ncbi:MAG: 4-(cytidine 5'-diphospho)-2-C-methyl-D-erythritol kinase [Bauldia sp.]|nr:4-(cytidine 5'-diphospho)-2-C-methyl-D-erythritol kinase [Bauldia sp.]MCW5719196.1 4-(cytidine 5'-diphospho)-2-C-methyl-D-erythritol kinase [Bauldia sp.]
MPAPTDAALDLTDAATAAPVPSEAAPAKVNLALHVRGRRPDGYHDLDTLVVFAADADTVELAEGGDALTIDGPFGQLLRGDESENLVLRAARRLAARAGRSWPALRLTKNLPVAAGLGGGSADAAATLRLLTRAWRLPPGDADLAAEGIALGSDVPMCLRSRPLVARGRGERIEDVVSFPALAIVLVHPAVAVSTGQVFARLDAPDDPPLPELPDRFETVADFIRWLRPTRNGLADAARDIAPVIGNALLALSNTGAMFARMSGSGASCFGIFPFAEAAEHAARIIRGAEPAWWVSATTTGGS